MRADKQTSNFNTYSYNHSSKMKCKRVGKKECKHKITHRCVIEEETEVLGIKPLRCSSSGNRFTRQSVEIHGLARNPPSLIYPMHLSSPSSYSNKASRNRVLSNSPDLAIRSIASAKAWLFSMLPNNTKTSLDTLKGCGKCLGYQPLNGMEMER